ncbi:MAG TPA: hypothetical protein VF739_13420 [Ktedonobacterales bacterium]
MPDTSSDTQSAQHAITDVFDAERGSFLVRFPARLVVGIGLCGVVTLALTGFLGYPASATWADALFRQPWLLYLWLCALVLTLEVAVLRHPSVLRYRIAALTITGIAIVIVGITYFYRIPFQEWLNALLQQLFHLRVAVQRLVSSPWFYAALNFGVLLIFALDSARRWSRRARGLSPNARVDIGLGDTPDAKALPSMHELVSGDLLAGALLCGVLALIFRGDLVSAFWHLITPHVSVTGCTVSWPLGACVPPGNRLSDPPTLTFIDMILALLALPTGLLILALAGATSGLGALGGVAGRRAAVPVAVKDGKSAQAISGQVSKTLLDTLLTGLNRGGRGGATNASPAAAASESLLLPLRNVLWPPLIFLSISGVAQLAKETQAYFHGDKALGSEARLLGFGGLWLAVAVAGIVLALALLVFHGRLVTNTLRFLGLIGLILALTGWIYSLALWSFNHLLLLTHATTRSPFAALEWNTALSFAVFLAFAVALLARRAGRR